MGMTKGTCVPPTRENDAFAGFHYDDLHDFENEYRSALADWEDFPNRKFKVLFSTSATCVLLLN